VIDANALEQNCQFMEKLNIDQLINLKVFFLGLFITFAAPFNKGGILLTICKTNGLSTKVNKRLKNFKNN
jgi:hypothetical protein